MNASSHEIRFQSLFHEGRALCFPCDENGEVSMDSLSERARDNYLYARAVVGPRIRASLRAPEPLALSDGVSAPPAAAVGIVRQPDRPAPDCIALPPTPIVASTLVRHVAQGHEPAGWYRRCKRSKR